MSDTLELYYMPTCPFCRRVLNYMEVHNIDIPRHDITSEPTARTTLEEQGGKMQVPCLFINGKPLFESDDIITFLETAFHVNDEGDQSIQDVVQTEAGD
ncbi:glutaredoxin [Coriobacterium glomerans PW2]|uniref:Glutaredoxin n=1 Tax=Coriobacterium glomerans (strain ATCC 49209 / DSM 20642 / JCM 10262 / PW2) TaxID=700015 RepID=F2N9D8_CORGP|nr:glutathione S-transferase N-terminal domain-containing protein [Coriobacterium glomerans]AEB07886.1 glutaredoxin [Coriobacterium glomerans PW2]